MVAQRVYIGMRGTRPKTLGRSRPASAREKFEFNNQKRNEEAWKHEEMVSSAIEMKKKEWAAKFYTELGQKSRTNSYWKEREAIRKNLEERRNKLRKLFKDEEKLYEKERQEKRKSKTQMTENSFHPEIELLRARLEDLKRQNEEERKKLAEKLSYESWRKNNPELRQVESDRLNRFIMDAWVDQKQWKEDQRRAVEEEDRKREIEAAERRKIEEEEEKRKSEQEREQRLRWTAVLKEQMEELKCREKEEETRRMKETALVKEYDRLQGLTKQRDKMKEERKRKNLELFWARQHQVKLKKKTIDVQKELVEDSALLQDLRGFDDAGSSSEAEDEFRRESEWMQDVLQKQKNLEKVREKEYDLLFSEEAERMWLRREAEWEREQRARDKLFEDVMTGLERQVSDKMLRLKAEKEGLAKSKEELIFNIGDLQKKLEGEETKKQLKGLNKTEEKRSAPDRDTRRQELLMDQQIENRQKEIARLEEEMKNLWQESYVPPKYGRKRPVW